MSNKFKNGMAFYINLEESKYRNISVVKELEKININYERIDAVKEEFCSLGCLKSHYKTINKCQDTLKKYKYKWFLIVEDDMSWKLNINKVIEKIDFIDKNIELAPVWQLCECINGIPPTKHEKYPFIKYFKEPPYDHGRGTMNTTTGYIIRSDYLETLKIAWSKSIPLFEKGLELKRKKNNIDIGFPLWWYNADCEPWTTLQVKDKWYLLPIIIPSGSPSTIATKSFNKLYEILSK